MDTKLKEKFITQWQKYFNGAELPITFYYSDQPKSAEQQERRGFQLLPFATL